MRITDIYVRASRSSPIARTISPHRQPRRTAPPLTERRNTWKTARSRNPESQPCVSSRNVCGTGGFVPDRETFDADDEGQTTSGPNAARAIAVLNEAHAIRECEEHGWAKDRGDPHARERAILAARQYPPPGVPPDAAAAEVREVLDSIGDTCPECAPE